MFTIKVYRCEEYKSKIFILDRGDKFPYSIFFLFLAKLHLDT